MLFVSLFIIEYSYSFEGNYIFHSNYADNVGACVCVCVCHCFKNRLFSITVTFSLYFQSYFCQLKSLYLANKTLYIYIYIYLSLSLLNIIIMLITSFFRNLIFE